MDEICIEKYIDITQRFFVPALLIDNEYKIKFKNRIAQTQCGFLRIGSLFTKKLSEAYRQKFFELLPEQRMRAMLMTGRTFIGCVILRKDEGFIVKIMTQSIAVSSRLLSFYSSASESEMLNRFSFNIPKMDEKNFEAVSSLLLKRDTALRTVSSHAVHLVIAASAEKGMHPLSCDYSKTFSDMKHTIENALRSDRPKIIFTDNIETDTKIAVGKKDFCTCAVLLIEFAYALSEKRNIKVTAGDAFGSFYYCVDFECGLPLEYTEMLCENDFEGKNFLRTFGDLFFTLSCVKELCAAYTYSFYVHPLGGNFLQFRIEGDLDSNYINEKNPVISDFALSQAKEEYIGKIFDSLADYLNKF